MRPVFDCRRRMHGQHCPPGREHYVPRPGRTGVSVGMGRTGEKTITKPGSGTDHTMAALRNLTIGLLRLNGRNKIKETTEAISRDRNRALSLLAT